MKIYVVHSSSPGYAREDANTFNLIGAYVDQELAKKVALVGHGKVSEIELNAIFPGIKQDALMFGVDLAQA